MCFFPRDFFLAKYRERGVTVTKIYLKIFLATCRSQSFLAYLNKFENHEILLKKIQRFKLLNKFLNGLHMEYSYHSNPNK